MDIAAINRMSPGEFLTAFGGVYEHSPWVAGRGMERRPFQSSADLIRILAEIVDRATDEEKLALIRAHPDLAGKLARAGALTAESTREQAGLGLDRLADAEYETFSRLNSAYREKFGFPFIICARLTTKDGVLAAFETRLHHSAADEREEAIRQIHHIARLRIEDMLG